VSVRIHDYVHVKSESLSAAREVVTREYDNVGVGIRWLAVLHGDASGKLNVPGGHDAHVLARLTINIMSSSMAARGGVSPNVLGFVAVPPEGGMGRIGYVVYDRVPQLAAATQLSESDVLGVILANDIRRLILGVDSEAHDGVATDRADRRDRERADPFALNFSPADLARLRATLESDSASSAGATVGTGGTTSQGQCITGDGGRR
jgi:hypothetical protein